MESFQSLSQITHEVKPFVGSRRCCFTDRCSPGPPSFVLSVDGAGALVSCRYSTEQRGAWPWSASVDEQALSPAFVKQDLMMSLLSNDIREVAMLCQKRET